jgi:glucosamine--fructose-6-phosphate aminotransferase (isomerizing)
MTDSRLLVEIREQPEVAARLLAAGPPVLDAVAAEVHRRAIGLVVIAARGTSDHAAVYAQYVLGARNGLTVALAAPSLVTLYGASPHYGNALVIGLSQSGRSPDVVGVVEAARAQGALTLAITNEPESPLALAAEHRMDLAAGDERSVAATKTYTAELLAVAMLSAALDDDDGARSALGDVPGAIGGALDAEPEAARIAADQATLDRAVVLGRGFGYATAREWSLKLKEVAQLWADPYSAADFAHGPVALLAPGSAVFASIAAGPAREALLDLVRALIRDVRADVLVLSDDAGARAVGRWALAVPAGLAEWLEPIAAIVPAQLHAMHLAIARGLDPERPRGLRKVTETR